MKRIAILIPTLAVAMLFNALPSFADDIYKSTMDEDVGAAVQKDECLLVAMNCPGSVDSFQQRIEKLNREINRGTDVYTGEELRILKDKLEDANRSFESITHGGA